MSDNEPPAVNRTPTIDGQPVTDGGSRQDPDITDVRRDGDEPPETPGVQQLKTLGSKSDRQSPPPQVSILRALLQDVGEKHPREVAARVDGLEGVLSTDMDSAGGDGSALMNVLLEASVDAGAIAQQLNRLEATAGTTSATFILDGTAGGDGGQQSDSGDSDASSGDETVPDEFDLPSLDDLDEDDQPDGASDERARTDSSQPDVERSAAQDEQSDPIVDALRQAVATRVRERGGDVESVSSDALAEELAGLLVETDTLDSYVRSSSSSQSTDVEATLENLDRRLSTLESTVEQLAERPTVKPETVEGLRRQIADHGETLATVEADVADQNQTLVAHEETLEKQDAAVDQLTATVDSQDERLAALDDELGGLADDGAVESLRERVTALDDALEQHRDAFESVDEHQETVESIEDNLGSLKRRVTSVEATASDIRAEMSNAADDTVSLEETTAELDDELDELAGSLAAIHDRVDAAELSLDDYDQTFETLRESLDRKDGRIDDLATTVRDHGDHLSEQDERVDGVEETLEDQQDQLAVQDQEVTDARDGIQELDDRLEKFDDRITSHEQSLASLVERIDGALEHVDEATAAVERFEEFEADLEELKSEAETGDALADRIASVDESLVSLEGDLEAELDRIDELASAIADIREWQRSLQMVSGSSPTDVDGNGVDAPDGGNRGSETELDARVTGEGGDREPTAPRADRGDYPAGPHDSEEAADGDPADSQ